jgi:hypothetical protein
MDEGRRRASKPGAFAPHKAFQCGPINRPRLSRLASKSAMPYNAHTAHTCDTTCQTIQRTVYTGVKSSFSTFVWIGASARRNVLEGERSFAVEADSDVCRGAVVGRRDAHSRRPHVFRRRFCLAVLLCTRRHSLLASHIVPGRGTAPITSLSTEIHEACGISCRHRSAIDSEKTSARHL